MVPMLHSHYFPTFPSLNMTQQQIQNLSFSKAISTKKKDDQSYRPYHNITTSGYGTECLSSSSDDEEMTRYE